jgi:hypothetical protein
MDAAPAEPAPPASPAGTARTLRTQAFRVAVELCRARFAATGSGRFAWGAAVAIAVGAFVIALSIRVTDGPAAPVGGLFRQAAGFTGWISGSLLALAAAKDTSLADRADGVEALVAARGVGASLLRSARTLAATGQIARTLGIPLAVLGLATAALAADVTSALRRVAAAALLLAWGVVAGVTLGALAAVSARIFGARGPSALATLVIGERLVAGSLGLAVWSVPGALEAVLSLVLGATGVGGGR